MKNPLINALLAATYIALLVFLIDGFLFKIIPDVGMLAPMTMLSLFVLSAAVMGYLFLGEPLQLYLDGKKKEAVAFFIGTTGTFALLVALWLATLFLFFRSV